MLLPVPVQVESLWLHLLVCGLSRRHHLPSGFRCPVSLLDHINFSVRTKVNLPNKTKHFCFVSACVWAFQTWYWSTLDRIYLELESLSRDVHLWLSSPPPYSILKHCGCFGVQFEFLDEYGWGNMNFRLSRNASPVDPPDSSATDSWGQHYHS